MNMNENNRITGDEAVGYIIDNVSESVGEEEESIFFDDENYCFYRKFDGIRIRSGFVVDAIEFIYND